MRFIILIIGFAFLTSTASALESSIEIFNKPLKIKQQRQNITVNKTALIHSEKGQKLNFRLLDGSTINLFVSEKELKPNGTIVLKAEGENKQNMLLTVGKKASFGSIKGNGMDYVLSFDQANGQFLNDLTINQTKIDLTGDMLFPPQLKTTPKKKSTVIKQGVTASKSSTIAEITLLAIYNSEFANGFSDPEARIQQAVEFTNQALTASGVNAQFKLVDSIQIGFSNTSSVNAILSQATAGQGAFNSLPNLRDSLNADMVTVLSFDSSQFSASGVAWINGNNPDFAFSSVRLSLLCCDVVFAHELGHNLGSGHERDAVLSENDSCDDGILPGGFTGFSCGHGNQGLDFGTIMSRIGNLNRNRFSNPSQTCSGVPCGIPEGQPNSADNVSSFNITSLLIEQFRQSVGPADSNNNAVIPPLIFPLLLEDD